MLIKRGEKLNCGYNPVATIGGGVHPAFMEFGVIRLDAGESFSDAPGRERALLLVEGDVAFEFDGHRETVARKSFLDENPACLHLSNRSAAHITANAASELAYVSVCNETGFDAKLYRPEECRTDIYGEGVAKGQCMRYVRTVFEDVNAPWSNLAIGEVINFPGKWSSYPPHHHRQPEIYYYRLYPSQGFGLGCEGEEAYVLHDRDTLVIEGDAVHPQAASPGYALYYLWAIPYTPVRWKGERVSFAKDDWLLDKNAAIWPDK